MDGIRDYFITKTDADGNVEYFRGHSSGHKFKANPWSTHIRERWEGPYLTAKEVKKDYDNANKRDVERELIVISKVGAEHD